MLADGPSSRMVAARRRPGRTAGTARGSRPERRGESAADRMGGPRSAGNAREGLRVAGAQRGGQPDRRARTDPDACPDSEELECAGVHKDEWQELLQHRPEGANGIPAPTVWNRPALTVAGTAPEILARWEAACTTCCSIRSGSSKHSTGGACDDAGTEAPAEDPSLTGGRKRKTRERRLWTRRILRRRQTALDQTHDRPLRDARGDPLVGETFQGLLAAAVLRAESAGADSRRPRKLGRADEADRTPSADCRRGRRDRASLRRSSRWTSAPSSRTEPPIRGYSLRRTRAGSPLVAGSVGIRHASVAVAAL